MGRFGSTVGKGGRTGQARGSRVRNAAAGRLQGILGRLGHMYLPTCIGCSGGEEKKILPGYSTLELGTRPPT